MGRKLLGGKARDRQYLPVWIHQLLILLRTYHSRYPMVNRCYRVSVLMRSFESTSLTPTTVL